MLSRALHFIIMILSRVSFDIISAKYNLYSLRRRISSSLSWFGRGTPEKSYMTNLIISFWRKTQQLLERWAVKTAKSSVPFLLIVVKSHCEGNDHPAHLHYFHHKANTDIWQNFTDYSNSSVLAFHFEALAQSARWDLSCGK